MRYNNLISPLTTLYVNMWHQPMYYVSYMTLYEIQEIFSTSMENQNYTFFSLWIFSYDPCMISRKSYMVLVWLPRIHTNHIWPGMITKNHIWPSTKSKKVIWWLTRVNKKYQHLEAVLGISSSNGLRYIGHQSKKEHNFSKKSHLSSVIHPVRVRPIWWSQNLVKVIFIATVQNIMVFIYTSISSVHKGRKKSFRNCDSLKSD